MKLRLTTPLFLILILSVFVSADPYVSCSCGSYPCSVGTCDLGIICDNGDEIDYSGTCEATGFGGGVCEYDETECEDVCIDGFGCAECENSGDCSSDYYFCSGDDRYERDFYCNIFSYSCTFDDDFIVDCTDYDGNVCSGKLAVKNSYGCTGGSCSIDSQSILADCSVYTTAYSHAYCEDSSTSRRERDLGVCDLDKLLYCDTIPDYDDTNCGYGCAYYIGEKEYEYQCNNALTYYLYYRGINGLCRIDNSESWSVTGSVNYCSYNQFCDNDELISSDTTPYNPCEDFEQTVILNQTNILQNDSFSIKTTSSQTYPPNVVCYDETNDGVYDVCHGTGCDVDIENTYCDGDACCSGNAYNYETVVDVSGVNGVYYIKMLGLETSLNLEYYETNSYTVSESYVAGSINENNQVIEKSDSLGLTVDYVGDPEVESVCWSDSYYKKECYGDVLVCAQKCVGYDYINTNLDSTFNPDTSEVGTRNVQVLITNGDDVETDSISLCVYDYANEFYCGTCNDGIQNDDETAIDNGGHCGTCFDEVLNGVETYIDYGGNCGTCYDGVKQSFETLDIDYGGVCGNCTGVKSSDSFWRLGHEISTDIPYDYGYCEDKSIAIISFIQFFVSLFLGLGFIFILFILIIIFILFTNLITLLITFTTSNILKKRKK